MIKVIKGDVLAVKTGIIVHGCNCQGVMGGGIALSVKNQFPSVYAAYRKTFETTGLKLGGIEAVCVDTDKYIVNANTQNLYGRGTRQVSYDAVAECFEKIHEFAAHVEETLGVKLPILFPAIGAGLGSGNWNILECIIDQSVSDHFDKILYVWH